MRMVLKEHVARVQKRTIHPQNLSIAEIFGLAL